MIINYTILVKVRVYSGDIISGYWIINDEGKKEYHDKNTHSFVKKSQLYSSNDFNERSILWRKMGWQLG